MRLKLEKNKGDLTEKALELSKESWKEQARIHHKRSLIWGCLSLASFVLFIISMARLIL